MGNESQDIASNSGRKDHIILLEISAQDLALFLRKPFCVQSEIQMLVIVI